MTTTRMIRNHAENLLVTNPNATIEDLLKRCYFATDKEVFGAVAGITKYSTLFQDSGPNFDNMTAAELLAHRDAGR